MIGPTFPRFTVSLSPNLMLPGLVRGHISGVRTACATGFDQTTTQRAAGEALERQIQFSRSKAEKLALIRDLDVKLSNWFDSIFSTYMPVEEVLRHRFEVVRTVNYRTKEMVLSPQVAFTLANHPDDRYMPNRDSSGSALHQTKVKARYAALAEFAERQALTLFWYYGHCNGSFLLNKIKLNNFQVNEMTRVLQARGKIVIFDLTLIYPYRSLLAVYLGVNDSRVYFSAGAAADLNWFKALERAVIELYQAYTLMHQLYDAFECKENYANDGITRNYMKFNTKLNMICFNNMLERNFTSKIEKLISNHYYITNLNIMDVLLYETILNFGRYNGCLYYAVAHGVNAFPTMNLSDEDTRFEHRAALTYGFSSKSRCGPLPFA